MKWLVLQGTAPNLERAVVHEQGLFAMVYTPRGSLLQMTFSFRLNLPGQSLCQLTIRGIRHGHIARPDS